MMSDRDRAMLLDRVVRAVLEAASPGPMVRRALDAHPLPSGSCRLLAVGKASCTMAEAALEVLGGRVASALVVGVDGGPGVQSPLIERLVADHPLPTARNTAAAERVRAFAADAAAAESLLVLLSGGASALLCLPRRSLGLQQIASVTDALLRAGAPIEALNTVRKHCEVLKGGGLAAMSGAGSLMALVLSDVLGDRLDVIGSGPTAPDPTTFVDALGVLERWGVDGVSPAVHALLRRGAAGEESETVKPGDPIWARVQNRVIGGNHVAIDAAVEAVRSDGGEIAGRRERVEGEAAAVGRSLAREARSLLIGNGTPSRALVWGGETTVTVGTASGLGGRNQELALAAAIGLDGASGVSVLSLATDGRDGPTDAAGACVDGQTCARIRRAGIDPNEALGRHDSHTALDAAGALRRTGPTGTNINDVMMAIVDG